MSDKDEKNPVARELAKLSVKISMLCQEVADLKKFHLRTIEWQARWDERQNNIEERLHNVEKWVRNMDDLDIPDRVKNLENWKNELISDVKTFEFSRRNLKATFWTVLLSTSIGSVMGAIASWIIIHIHS